MSQEVFVFGPFQLFPGAGLLLREGARIPLGSRALSILGLFVRRPGELVTAQDLYQHAWPNTHVEDSNLRVQLAALRKALLSNANEARYIVTESGRGYRFVAEVTRRDVSTAPAFASATPRSTGLPVSLVWPVGREEALALLLEQLSRTRLLTVIGGGGIGKTTVALTAAARFCENEGLAPCFVDLSSVDRADKIPAAIAAALQLGVPTEAAMDVLLRTLQDKRILLLLDNCEHLVQGAADAAEKLLGVCIGTKILATSREPLRCHGEFLHKLATLPVPPADAGMTAATARTYAGVQLFLERALAMDDRFLLTDANAPMISQICRQLDGLPLALELAAGTASVLGIESLASGLDDRLPMLGHGPRTTPRHRTLRTMLDWSYDLMSSEERVVLDQLSIFRSPFGLEAAFAVAGDGRIQNAEFANILGNLTAKSLLTVEIGETALRFRLLDTTRAYCAEKLDLAGDRAAVSARHASFVQQDLVRAQADWRVISKDVWWDRHGRHLDDVRAALRWAFSPGGNVRQAIAMTIVSAPLWLGLSQLGEARRWTEQALSALPEAELVGTREEMQLCQQLGILIFNVEGPGPKARTLYTRALEIARTLDDVSGQATARWTLVGERVIAGDYGAAASISRALSGATGSIDDLESVAIARRIQAATHYYLGEFADAAVMIERAIEVSVRASASYNIDYRYHHLTTARANQARFLWMRGSADRARELIRITAEEAADARDASSLVYVLCHIACPLALWLGDDAMAEKFVRDLVECAEENALSYMRAWGSWFAGAMDIRAGRSSRDRNQLEAEFRSLRKYDRELLITVASGLVDRRAVARANAGGVGWASAEILRAEGERLRNTARRSTGEQAEAFFLRALDLARRQGCLAWELRCAATLGRLVADRGERHRAIEIVGPVVDKFTEGFATADMRAALAVMSS